MFLENDNYKRNRVNHEIKKECPEPDSEHSFLIAVDTMSAAKMAIDSYNAETRLVSDML